MNTKTAEKIREACEFARSIGAEIKQGAWTEVRGGKIVSCCAMGALLLTHGAGTPQDPAKPGYVRRVCEILDVTPSWLYRFWMGFDRGYQIMMIDEEKKTERKDEVSAFGIQLWKELSV